VSRNGTAIERIDAHVPAPPHEANPKGSLMSGQSRACAVHSLRLVIFAATILLVGFLTDAGAGMVEFERIKVHATIAASGRVELAEPRLGFGFVSDVQFGPQTPPTGGMNILMGDGSVRTYQAVGATVLAGDHCLVFFLGGAPGEIDPSDAAIAVVRNAPGARAIWVELQIQQVFPQTLQFAVPGEIRLTRSDPPPGSVGLWFSMRYLEQAVVLDPAGTPAAFTARAFIGSDHNGWGGIVLALPGEPSPLVFEPVFGVALPATGTGPGYIVILTVLADAPLQIENLGVATVHPDPALPGYDIWDFTSNTVVRNQPLHVTFDADGETRFYGQQVVR
jgi:prepilin-type processing-associated H-X9-DG protein